MTYNLLSGLVAAFFGVLLIIWMIICLVNFYRASKRYVNDKGLKASLHCDKCNADFTMPMADLPAMSLRVTKTVSLSPGTSRTTITTSKKKVVCPACGKKVWAQVTNQQQLANDLTGVKPVSEDMLKPENMVKDTAAQLTSPIMKLALEKFFLKAIIGGVIIVALAVVSEKIIDAARPHYTYQELKEMSQEERDMAVQGVIGWEKK